jgi:3-hydroxyacyl-CoA dehydrogenase
MRSRDRGDRRAARLEARPVRAKVAPHLAPHAILASNTSGLSINALVGRVARGAAHALLRRALLQSAALHAPGRADRRAGPIPRCSTRSRRFLTTTLGKGVIRAKDTPNFIANRVGVFSMLATMRHTRRLGSVVRRGRRADRPAIGRAEERDVSAPPTWSASTRWRTS